MSLDAAGPSPITEVRPVLSRHRLIDLGTDSARSLLRAGWLDDERNPSESFAWAAGEAALSIPLQEGQGYRLVMRVESGPDLRLAPLTLRVSWNGQVVQEHALTPRPRLLEVRLPASAVRAENALELRTLRPGSGAPVKTPYALRVDYLSFRAEE